MTVPETLILTRGDVRRLLTLAECVSAVEDAFRRHAQGRSLAPGVLAIPVRGGGFHIKAAGLELSRTYVAVKTNGNFMGNRERFGMENIQGTIVLCDGENGVPLAVLDSIEITILRTGAATAVAAERLARRDARVATVCGCGNQGRVQLRALAHTRRIERAYAYDLDSERRRRFSAEMGAELAFPIEPVDDPSAAIRASDLVATCTPSRVFYVKAADVPRGSFIAAVGADSPEKQELEPALLKASRVVVDVLEQCAEIGDLHHAIKSGAMELADVHADLAEIVSGAKPGRVSERETFVFDSTGTALEDVAAAAAVYEKALAAGAGLRCRIGA